MGIGLLGFPYAMRVSGLIPGLIISTMCALITNYTAKVGGEGGVGEGGKNLGEMLFLFVLVYLPLFFTTASWSLFGCTTRA